MKINDIYLAFLSKFDSMNGGGFSSFFCDFQSVSASLHASIQGRLTEVFNLTGSTLPTYENVSDTEYYAEYGNGEVQVRIDGSGIGKLFGSDLTTAIILAGGLGSRLRTTVPDLPAPKWSSWKVAR